MKKAIHYFVVALLLCFGLVTLFLSTSIIFDLFDIRAKEGNYVLFIVWANFVASLFYLISVYGLLTTKKWTYQALGSSAIVLIIAFIALLFYIQSGGIYEEKTIYAMIFRTALTVAFTLFAFSTINKKSVK